MKTSQALLDAVAACPPACSMWRHYRGGVYRVIGSAVREDDLTPLVLYRECRDGLPSVTFARPLAEWAGQVWLDAGEQSARQVRRFRPLAADAPGGGT